MPRALLSVSDKEGLVAFARDLHERGWEILSTGGTAAVLTGAGVPVREVSEVTGHPEIMDGRVKTLHPAVHAGLLGRADHVGDREQMTRLGYAPIDLVAVNLYPFRETVSRSGTSPAEAVEQIDIGGPSMLRSAAKNHERVWAVCDPADYPRVTAALRAPDGAALRRTLAAKVFRHTSAYDAAIADYLHHASGPAVDRFPEQMTLRLHKIQDLRYGENPDQGAAFYAEGDQPRGLARMRQLHGKELSFNNLLDVDGALLAVDPWMAGAEAACAIVKHTTPCGLGVGADDAEAYARALATDPTSAFGSVIAFTTEVSARTATLLRPLFVEAVVAPGFSESALRMLREKRNLRLLEMPLDDWANEPDLKRVRGGILVQDRPSLQIEESQWRTVTRREPTDEEWRDLRFAWRAVAPVKSNAILLARQGATIGIGAGQMSRVDASRLAVLKAQDAGAELQGCVLASDAFFPFRDGVDAAAEAGVRAIVQPGGSVRDEEVIAAADEHGIAMVFTGRRLFRH